VKSRVYDAIGVLTAGPVRRLFRFTSEGEEHLPRDRGFVLAANHVSNLDPWPLGLPLYPERQLRFMAKVELYRPPLGWILEWAGAFRVKRGRHDEEAIQRAVELAQAGEVVVIFPEGTRRKKGLAKRYKPRRHTGAARVALTAQVPLVPAAIGGTDRLLRLGPLRVAYGPPVQLDDLRDMEIRGAAKIATDRLMEAIHSLERTL
jgi:1-acyl-sn-glycerol-3-phosphate acyltransferase